MIEEHRPPTEREEIEMLLPWYVTGRISAADAARVDAYVRQHPDFARHIETARDERAAAIAVSEAQGVPSARATDPLFERIAVEPMPVSHSVRQKSASLLSAISGFFANPSPVAVRYAAIAAAVVVLVQAAALGHLMTGGGEERGGFRTASGPESAEKDGTFVLVGFADNASIGQIAALLDGVGGRIADGPLKGGLYRVRLAKPEGGGDVQGATAIAALKNRKDLVRIVLPSR